MVCDRIWVRVDERRASNNTFWIVTATTMREAESLSPSRTPLEPNYGGLKVLHGKRVKRHRKKSSARGSKKRSDAIGS